MALVDPSDPAHYIGGIITATRASASARVRDQRRRMATQSALDRTLAELGDRISGREVPSLTANERERLLASMQAADRAWAEAAEMPS